MQFWKDYTPQELKELIAEKPLTKDLVSYILQSKIKKIVFLENLEHTFTLPGKKYVIFIGLQRHLEERGPDLVHEMCHVYYEAMGIPLSTPWVGPEREKGTPIEELLEKETDRFYQENKDFVHTILAGYSEPTNCN